MSISPLTLQITSRGLLSHSGHRKIEVLEEECEVVWEIESGAQTSTHMPRENHQWDWRSNDDLNH